MAAGAFASGGAVVAALGLYRRRNFRAACRPRPCRHWRRSSGRRRSTARCNKRPDSSCPTRCLACPAGADLANRATLCGPGLQTPALQLSPTVQRSLSALQAAPSLEGSGANPHTPPTQVRVSQADPAAQALPQTPQLSTLFAWACVMTDERAAPIKSPTPAAGRKAKSGTAIAGGGTRGAVPPAERRACPAANAGADRRRDSSGRNPQRRSAGSRSAEDSGQFVE